ncbi:MAG: hypothetical protein ACOYK8_00560 [Alphaproteobacteria bacterium]
MTNSVQQADDGQPFDLSNLEQLLEAGRAITPQAPTQKTVINTVQEAAKRLADLKKQFGTDDAGFQRSIRQLYNQAAKGTPRAPEAVIRYFDSITTNFAHKSGPQP